MSDALRLAFTADLHWGVNEKGDEAARRLHGFLQADPPDVLILAGDIGAGENFEKCLAFFADLSCRKALVPGNHDIWVESCDARGDSLHLYEQLLPRISSSYGFHYLDQGPLFFPHARLGIAGTMNWYDYSWTIEELRNSCPDWEERLRQKRFLRGRHNDARFIRWHLDDARFTDRVAAELERQLQVSLTQVDRVIVVAHHPPLRELNYPAEGPPSVDRLLWEAFSGNRAVEALLARHGGRIPFVFCGHTHRAREEQIGPMRGYNIGGDYHWKRLLLLDWPQGEVVAHQFGDPEDKLPFK